MRKRSTEEAYKTHLQVMDYLFSTFPVARVLEIGMGDGSTPYFKKRGVTLFSIDTDASWFRKHWHERAVLTGEGKAQNVIPPLPFDIVLVDGDANRWPVVERVLEMRRFRFLVIHDRKTKQGTKERIYGYHNIPRKLEEEAFSCYREVIYNEVMTSVIFNALVDMMPDVLP